MISRSQKHSKIEKCLEQMSDLVSPVIRFWIPLWLCEEKLLSATTQQV